MAATESEIVVDDPDAPSGRRRHAVTSTRTVEVVVYVLLLALALVLGFDNWRSGMGWAKDGPQSGYLPFYLCVILAGASLWGLGVAFCSARPRAKTFVTRDQLRRVLQVFVPTFAVLPAHAVARDLRRELPAGRGLHAVHRPHRVVEVAADERRVRARSCS